MTSYLDPLQEHTHRLLRLVSRAFYTTRIAVVVDGFCELDAATSTTQQHTVSEDALAKHLQLARATVNAALGALRRDGLMVGSRVRGGQKTAEELAAPKRELRRTREVVHHRISGKGKQRSDQGFMTDTRNTAYYWYANPPQLCAAVEARRRAVMAVLSVQSSSQPMYVCSRGSEVCPYAGQSYTLLEARTVPANQRFPGVVGLCRACQVPLVLETVSGTGSGPQVSPAQLRAAFNRKIAMLIECADRLQDAMLERGAARLKEEQIARDGEDTRYSRYYQEVKIDESGKPTGVPGTNSSHSSSGNAGGGTGRGAVGVIRLTSSAKDAKKPTVERKARTKSSLSSVMRAYGDRDAVERYLRQQWLERLSGQRTLGSEQGGDGSVPARVSVSPGPEGPEVPSARFVLGDSNTRSTHDSNDDVSIYPTSMGGRRGESKQVSVKVEPGIGGDAHFTGNATSQTDEHTTHDTLISSPHAHTEVIGALDVMLPDTPVGRVERHPILVQGNRVPLEAITQMHIDRMSAQEFATYTAIAESLTPR